MRLPSGHLTTDYSLTPQDKGWGEGWPDCSPGRYQLKTVLSRNGAVLPVRANIAELVDILVEETERRGYVLVKGWCWAFACRQIAGTDRPSFHSWGLAVDINAPTNPYNSLGAHDIPDWVFALWAAYGFGIGAWYTGARKDYMHFEFMGTPADAAAMTALAKRAFQGVSIVDQGNAGSVAVLLRVGAAGQSVRQVQQRLITWGALPAGQDDGQFGPKTDAAVRQFQSRHGLAVDGVVGPRTLAALLTNPTPYPGVLIHEGVSGGAAKAVQLRLVTHGLLTQSQVDGRFGPRTKAAVQEFQRSKGLTDDGIVGPDTWRALHS